MPDNPDILDVDIEALGGSDTSADAGVSLEALHLLSVNESLLELVLPIISEMTVSVSGEIADVQFFISTSPLGSLEAALSDDTGLTAEIDATWESL